ncbi:alkane 1-monooxygenase [Stenotrophobium rhamnosiphilum]|uniref:Alkane 1-monooxygenase n=1 Tax=Stenotrophobium rhamnosiphilum TaxID=2029166 RepID=A0A2T5MIU2_9GAMM|nr:alkane 1-monooxygenase [Stenotrophobium rhamnosiphilum]PTU32478.1 alkane 1-monooxygenase [Stenotrophobium rhamnosiphilum]
MTTTTIKSTDWVDGKRSLWAMGLLIPLMPFIAWGLVSLTGLGLFWWFGPMFFYGIVPLADYFVGDDKANPPESAVAKLEEDRYYRYVTYAYIPLQFIATILGAWMAVNGGLNWAEMLGLIFTVGLVNGVGINTAHELGHKKENVERWFAKITLAPVAYGHFFVEHNRGHHVRVATPEDPASSRMGESFWSFLPRTMIGSFTSAWELEKVRLEREGKSVWSLQNHNLQAWSMTVVFFGAISLVLGPIALLFLVVQAFYGATVLESVNYLEHYGLMRQKQADGRYERCEPRHSWNSNNTVTNLLLYQLQRHSDHHAHGTRRYQSLRHFEEAPQLPSGYTALVPVTYFPALWFMLMDRRVVAHYNGDLSKANLQPEKREALMARYHRPQVVEKAA